MVAESVGETGDSLGILPQWTANCARDRGTDWGRLQRRGKRHDSLSQLRAPFRTGPLEALKQELAGSEQPCADLALLLHFLYSSHDFGLGVKLLVVLVGHVDVHVKILEQRQAHVYMHGSMPRQPDFVIHPRLLGHDMRAFVQACKEQAERDSIDHFGVEFYPLVLGRIDPDPSPDLCENFGLLAVRLEARPRFGGDDVGVPPFDLLGAYMGEIVGVGNFFTKSRPSSRSF